MEERKIPEKIKKNVFMRRISPENASILLYAEHLSCFATGREVYGFVVESSELGHFFESLAKNFIQIPDGSRFHLVVYDECSAANEHWFLVDCYKKQNILHTLTIDAAMVISELLPALELIAAFFPDGNHYSYFSSAKDKSMPRKEHLHALTREHATLIINIDPEHLYLHELKHLNKKSIQIFEDMIDVPTEVIFFNHEDLAPIKSLAPLFHVSIHPRQYFEELERYQKHKTVVEIGTLYLNAAFGYAALPVILHLNKKLSTLEKPHISDLLSQFIDEFEKSIPRKTLHCRMFRALHLNTSQKYIDDIRLLASRCDLDYTSPQIAQAFCDVTLCYAGYLKVNNSVRTFALLSCLLQKLNSAIDQDLKLLSQSEEVQTEDLIRQHDVLVTLSLI